MSDLMMGQRTNRKRIRHRPNRARRSVNTNLPSTFCTNRLPSATSLSLQPPQQICHQQNNTSPSAMSIYYSYNSTSASTPSRPTNREWYSSMPSGSPTHKAISTTPPTSRSSLAEQEMGENALSRDLRVFGGSSEEDEMETDLRGPMLDVVLGLFNGVDYDDESC